MFSYMELSNPMYDFITSEIVKTYKEACVCWIEVVENKMLTERYDKYKNSLREPNEKLLYHGTSKEIAYKIAQEGFRSEFNKVSACGLGTYFSTRAEYSKDYSIMKSNTLLYTYGKGRKTRSYQAPVVLPDQDQEIAFMLVSDVAVGVSTQGSNGKKLPKEFDSFTDNPKQPDMYIVERNDACNPRYIVAFYPNAPK